MELPDDLKEFLEFMDNNYQGDRPLLRILMSKEEIKKAEKLVKLGLLCKGTSIENSKLKVYYKDTH